MSISFERKQNRNSNDDIQSFELQLQFQIEIGRFKLIGLKCKLKDVDETNPVDTIVVKL